MGDLKFVLDDSSVKKKYEEVGRAFAEAIGACMLGMLIPEVLMEKHSEWERWEKEYAERGFRTLSFEDFFERAYSSKNIDHLFEIRRKDGEELVYYAPIYRQKLLEQLSQQLKESK